MTDGTSAQFTNQFAPDATSRAADQPLAVRSANRSVAFCPSRSTQLNSSPRAEDESCGCALFGPAGERAWSIATGQALFERPCPLTATVSDPIRPASRAKRESIEG